MLPIIQNSASAKSYCAHSDYLSEGQELTGRCGGRTAQMLDLSGDVDKLSVDRLCDTLDPRSGKQLTLRSNPECTFRMRFRIRAMQGQLPRQQHRSERGAGSGPTCMRGGDIDASNSFIARF